jgi:hypothetical protein
VTAALTPDEVRSLFDTYLTVQRGGTNETA